MRNVGGRGGWAGPAVNVFSFVFLFGDEGIGCPFLLSLLSFSFVGFFLSFILAGRSGGEKEIGLPQFDS